MNTNFPPFYVGQKVVSLFNTEDLIKGNEYVITRIAVRSCGCWSVQVGIKRLIISKYCTCDHDIRLAGSDWLNAKKFAPIESTFQSISFEKVVEIESPLIGIN